ncbi:MAG: bifunctional methionine sulfoxide reductase B/A protein [Myxococcota bacterium]|nr:bifunctional methionine sulfoxide reductase B/A protein [Myxococcota bacterium]
MSRTFTIVVAAAAVACFALWSQSHSEAPPRSEGSGKDTKRGWKTLSTAERHIVESCGTEPPGTGKWLKHESKGTYTCTRCGAPLFSSETKFDSRSGWPSFDDGLTGAVRELPDGMRVEIRCARCDGHLGHVFRGEGFTSRDTRHCVNSLSMDFHGGPLEEAFFAGGCFWGVELLLESVPGVLNVQSGYMGGTTKNPSYRQVIVGLGGHAEAVRVTFDPAVVSYQTLAQRFFEIHDPTQVDRQGPDVGAQYRSAIFVTGAAQDKVAKGLIKILERDGLKVATRVHPAGVFWPAEDYHQDYYVRTGKEPYCHSRNPRKWPEPSR